MKGGFTMKKLFYVFFTPQLIVYLLFYGAYSSSFEQARFGTEFHNNQLWFSTDSLFIGITVGLITVFVYAIYLVLNDK